MNYKYKPFISIELSNIITMIFDIDTGNDEPPIRTLERWVDDEAYNKHFPEEGMYFNISPDLGEVNIYTTGRFIIVRCFVGVIAEEEGEWDIVDSGEGLFFINPQNEEIESFIYKGEFG